MLAAGILAVLCLALLPASDADTFEYDGLVYEIVQVESWDAAVVVGYNHSGEEGPWDLVIPEELSYSGHQVPVSSIGEHAFDGCSFLRTVNMQDLVVSIGDYAFSGCTSLEYMDMPETFLSIGSHAFSGCTSLGTVEISRAVRYIGHGAFSGCTSLKGFYDWDVGRVMLVFNGRLVAFAAGSGATEVIIPRSVTSIGDEAFFECSSIELVSIPDSVTSIGDYAFSGCSSLETVAVGSSVESIGEGAFDYDFYNGGTLLTSASDISGHVYALMDERFVRVKSVSAPSAAGSLTYTGRLQTGVPSGEGYTVTGGGATGAGSYTAVLRLESGYVWSDGTVRDREVPWSIAKAVLTASYAGETVTEGSEPAYEVVVEGFVGGEDASNASDYVAPAIANSDLSVGNHTLTPSGGSAVNYSFTYVPGVLIVVASDPGPEVEEFAVGALVYRVASADPAGVSVVGCDGDSLESELEIPRSVGYGGVEYAVVSIGDYAFSGCTSLESVSIPTSVMSVGDGAFS